MRMRLISLTFIMGLLLCGCSKTQNAEEEYTENPTKFQPPNGIKAVVLRAPSVDEKEIILQSAISEYYSGEDEPGGVASVDLDGDSISELVVTAGGSTFCGSGGCASAVLKFDERMISTFAVEGCLYFGGFTGDTFGVLPEKKGDFFRLFPLDGSNQIAVMDKPGMPNTGKKMECYLEAVKDGITRRIGVNQHAKISEGSLALSAGNPSPAVESPTSSSLVVGRMFIYLLAGGVVIGVLGGVILFGVRRADRLKIKNGVEVTSKSQDSNETDAESTEANSGNRTNEFSQQTFLALAGILIPFGLIFWFVWPTIGPYIGARIGLSPEIANAFSGEPQSTLEKVLVLGTSTKDDFNEFEDNGGLNNNSNWRGLSVKGMTLRYGKNEKLAGYFLQVNGGAKWLPHLKMYNRENLSTKQLRELLSPVCGINWTFVDGDRSFATATSEKIECGYGTKAEGDYEITVFRRGAN